MEVAQTYTVGTWYISFHIRRFYLSNYAEFDGQKYHFEILANGTN